MSVNPVTAGNSNANTPSQSSTASATLGSNINDFLHLLTVQLQNQDPTSPLDTNQVTAQIAQLSQVEQQINTNKNLETLITLMNATQYNSIISYIGKQIEAPGNAGALQTNADGTKKAEFAYYLQSEADHTAITIKDGAGNVVYEGAGTNVAGRNQFNWDGKNSDGQTMPDGTYTIEVKAQDASNNDIASQVFTTGVVTSIDSVNGNVYASFGGLAIPVSNITSIMAALT
jgi:flagellar basal-body rod modification protein FlgD